MTPSARERGQEADLPTLRQQYLEQIDLLVAAGDRVRASLDNAQGVLTVLRAHVSNDGKISDLAGLMDPIALRADLRDSLDNLERTRHRQQQLLFHLLLAEGKTMADIGRVWGISRQLVSRLVNEPL